MTHLLEFGFVCSVGSKMTHLLEFGLYVEWDRVKVQPDAMHLITMKREISRTTAVGRTPSKLRSP